MTTAVLSSAWRAWPPAAGGGNGARFYARAFGTDAADLEIAFDALPRPLLVSALLSNGVRNETHTDLDIAEAWRWHVADRLQALLALVHASGADTLHALAPCPQPTCRQSIELELPLASFARAAPDTTLLQIAAGARADVSHVAVRLPTGADQRAWRDTAPTGAIDEHQWARDLVVAVDDVTPARDWQPPAAWPADWIDAIGDALAALDPLTALTLDIACPYCEATVAVDVDLEQLALTRLHQVQHALLDDVHRLAEAYHWSERDIVNLPAWRRAHYRARIGTEWP